MLSYRCICSDMYLSVPLPRTIFQGALDGATNTITSTYPNIASAFFPDESLLDQFLFWILSALATTLSTCKTWRGRIANIASLWHCFEKLTTIT
jgi:hypothetical protein